MENATQMHGGIKYYYPFYFILFFIYVKHLLFLSYISFGGMHLFLSFLETRG